MSDGSAEGVVLGPGEGVVVGNPLGGSLTFKLRSAETGGAVAAFESVVPPGEGPPLHVHANEDEVWYALEGRFRFRLADLVADAPAGTLVFVPRGVVHTWQNAGDTPARLLALVMPAGLEAFFERFAALPPGVSPAEEFRRLGAEAGMTVVGPPLGASDAI
jgi:quercetin dioxygenase-like cupin family protein